MEFGFLGTKSSSQTPYADLKHKLVKKKNSTMRSVLDFKRKDNPFLADANLAQRSQSPKNQDK
jgi:hypothetical protein